MSAGCLRWVLSHAVRTVCGGSPGYRTPASRLLICSERSNNVALSWRWSLFSTTADDSGESPEPKKKKQDPRARATISSVGRKIQSRHLQVISETGENLGIMHRVNVIRLMDEQGLKLVLLSEHKDPPVYRLMSGKQIHEEQLKLREKQKAKAAPVQVKELTFSFDIAPHDLTTKLKQVQSWLDKKHHVRITLQSRRRETTLSLVRKKRLQSRVVNRPKDVLCNLIWV
ncbi:translation initiation factor IF-3, mitochondrial [Centroberyx affinis]|uniref:translation initiation factor IF-3, mitochondrial n=1 Tax=Centroberyx affinis TaxID=166261 RepID=UPI003A5C5BEB